MTTKKKPTTSKVADRLGWLLNQRARVRAWWGVGAQTDAPNGDVFEAVLMEAFPLGRDYFLVFRLADGRRELLKSGAILAIEEL